MVFGIPSKRRLARAGLLVLAVSAAQPAPAQPLFDPVNLSAPLLAIGNMPSFRGSPRSLPLHSVSLGNPAHAPEKRTVLEKQPEGMSLTRLLERQSEGHAKPHAPELPRLAEKWREMNARIEHDLFELTSCEALSCNAGDLALIASRIGRLRKMPEAERAALVKRLIDRQVSYRPDADGADRWSSPLSTLLRGYGDCEDFAFLTYALLRHAGFPPDALSIHILQNRSTGSGHALLQLRLGTGSSVVFDNRKRRLTGSIDPVYRQVALVANGVFSPAPAGNFANRPSTPQFGGRTARSPQPRHWSNPALIPVRAAMISQLAQSR